MKSLFLVLLSVAVIGCSKKASSPIVGKWETTSMAQFSREGGIKMTYIYAEDGRCYDIRSFADGTEYKGENEVRYVVSGNEVSYTRTIDNSKWKDRFVISGNTLTLTTIDAGGNKEFLDKKYVFERSP